MARTVQQCYEYITTNLTTEFATYGITITPSSWSKRNVLRNICYVYAIAQALFEQLNDLAIEQMNEIQSISAAATPLWIQNKMFKFQYSATNPQVLQIINDVPAYPVVDEDLRIIKGCSVTTTVVNSVIIKTAKGSPLEPLAVGEVSAAQTYIDQLGTAGINYTVLSLDSDKLYVEAEVFYQGLYSPVIQTTVISALDSYLENLSVNNFNGYVYALDIERVIRSVAGVNDVVVNRVSGRYDAQAVFGGIDLVLANELINRRYQTGAGYIIQEDTPSYTFADTLTFTAE